MRMWEVPARLLCRQHLLGEHVELHMLASHLNRGRRLRKLRKFVNPWNLRARHAEIIEEMSRRGYNHFSPLPNKLTMPERFKLGLIARSKRDYKELAKRCVNCAENIREDG